MKRFVVATLLAASSALAQQPAQRPSDEEINARIEVLTAQRNEAQNQVAVLAGQARAKAQTDAAEIERLKKEAAACKPAAKAEEKK